MGVCEVRVFSIYLLFLGSLASVCRGGESGVRWALCFLLVGCRKCTFLNLAQKNGKIYGLHAKKRVGGIFDFMA